jgi:predicted RNase H-related nuclease YkuK (DUF458 family)
VEWPVAKDFKQRLAELKTRFPDCQFSLRGQILVVTGTTEELASIATTLVNWRTPQQGSEQVYTLSTQATRETILATIAQETGRSLEFAPELKRALDERIELSVTNVGLEEFLNETLRASNLKFRLENDKLLIYN